MKVFEDARRYLEAAERAGLRRFVVSSSANTKDVLHVTGLESLVEGRVDGNTITEKHLKGKAGTRLVPRRRPGGRGFGRSRLPCSRMRWQGSKRAARASSATSSVSTGSTRSTARASSSTARRQSSHLSTNCFDSRVTNHLSQRRLVVRAHAERYPPEPWELREVGLDLDDLARSESLFALSNGHIGARGTLDEGDPHALPGTYLNSFFENRPLPYAEAGYGFPEVGQTILNVTDGKIIRLLVDDEPFDLRYGEMLHHDRVLDLRTGILSRVVEWAAPVRSGDPGAFTRAWCH